MVRSGISVEVCHVLEEGSELPKKALKKGHKAKKEKAAPKPRTNKGKKRERDSGSDTEEEWVGQSSSESSQDVLGRRPRKKPKKTRDPEPEQPTTARYSSPEL